jgi:hypothetical protein
MKLFRQGAAIAILALFGLGCADEPLAGNAAPRISITTPLNSATVAGAVDLSADVTDDRGVARVDFIVDGTIVGSDSEAPYEAVWMAPGDGALHSVNVEAVDADGAVANTVVRVRTEQGTTIVVTNHLLFPINVTVNGVLVGSVAGESTAQKNIGKVDTLTLRWSLVRATTTAGTSVGDDMGGEFPVITAPAGAELFDVDNLIEDKVFMVPVVTNTTPQRFLMAANVGLPEENRCDCTVLGNTSDVAIGYYVLPTGGNVRGYRAEIGYSGPFIFWEDGPLFRANLQPESGRINLLADFVPATRGADPTGTLRGAGPSSVERIPGSPRADRSWSAPPALQAPLLPRR